MRKIFSTLAILVLCTSGFTWECSSTWQSLFPISMQTSLKGQDITVNFSKIKMERNIIYSNASSSKAFKITGEMTVSFDTVVSVSTVTIRLIAKDNGVKFPVRVKNNIWEEALKTQSNIQNAIQINQAMQSRKNYLQSLKTGMKNSR